MTADVVIGTLRASRNLSAARSAVSSLQPLARSYGRSILLVRHLSACLDDDRGMRRRVTTLRNNASRPARGQVDPWSAAVIFEDEQELLLCLSEDLLLNRTRDRWWWATRLAGHRFDSGAALASAWRAQPRWVPSVLTELLRRHPNEVAAALTGLRPAYAAAVLDAVADEHLSTRTVAESTPSPSGTCDEPLVLTGPAAGLCGPARVLVVLALTVAGSPGLARQYRFSGWLASARAAGPDYGPASVGSTPAAWVNVDDTHRGAAGGQHPEPPGRPVERTAKVTPLHRPRPQVGAAAPWYPRPWEGGGAETTSRMATMLYTINLIDRFGLADSAGASTGWAVVEAVARRLLRDLPVGLRRPLLADPLLPLLGELDTRRPGLANPVRLGARLRPVRSFITRHHMDVKTFTHPGRILVSRTHVDVLLTLDDIDLSVRACGLDQDPGWVPHLGRIVLFHFDDVA